LGILNNDPGLNSPRLSKAVKVATNALKHWMEQLEERMLQTGQLKRFKTFAAFYLKHTLIQRTHIRPVLFS